MKNIREMTDDQFVIIAKLALQDVVNFDHIFSLFHGANKPEYKLKITRELYDEKENLLVIRGELDGMSGCTVCIWEEDFNVDVAEHDHETQTANQVKIVKQLIEWGYV